MGDFENAVAEYGARAKAKLSGPGEREALLSGPVSEFITAVGALAPATAMAREGAQSVGKGLKCYTMAVKQPDGTITYELICYKGI